MFTLGLITPHSWSLAACEVQDRLPNSVVTNDFKFPMLPRSLTTDYDFGILQGPGTMQDMDMRHFGGTERW